MTERHYELGTDGPRVIVVGVDGSEVSLRAAAYAMGVARRHDAHLIAVKVESEIPDSARHGVALGLTMLPAVCELPVTAQKQLEAQLAADANSWSTRCTLMVRTGDPAAQLARAADEAKADLVVVGASTSLAHRLAGSIPQRLSRRPKWVLTIVP